MDDPVLYVAVDWIGRELIVAGPVRRDVLRVACAVMNSRRKRGEPKWTMKRCNELVETVPALTNGRSR